MGIFCAELLITGGFFGLRALPRSNNTDPSAHTGSTFLTQTSDRPFGTHHPLRSRIGYTNRTRVRACLGTNF